jgi:hypothetical protein
MVLWDFQAQAAAQRTVDQRVVESRLLIHPSYLYSIAGFVQCYQAFRRILKKNLICWQQGDTRQIFFRRERAASRNSGFKAVNSKEIPIKVWGYMLAYCSGS